MAISLGIYPIFRHTHMFQVNMTNFSTYDIMGLYSDLMDSKWDIASGNLLQFAIENDPVEIVDLQLEHGWIFHSFLLTFTRGFCYGL